jgi:DNA-binding NtrC family response regulator
VSDLRCFTSLINGHRDKTSNLPRSCNSQHTELFLGIRFAQSPQYDIWHREKRIVTGRILLVEADVVLGAVLAEVLRHNGYEVSVVTTLIEGEINRFQSPGAVILDIDTTPVESELAWLDALWPYDESLPIVLMGLQVSQELRNRLRLQLGLQKTDTLTIVQKPFRNDELLAAVRLVEENSLPGQVNEI